MSPRPLNIPGLPGVDDLPLTEGPPEQAEPEGHTLSGPPPGSLPKEVRQLSVARVEMLTVVRALPVVTGPMAIKEMQKFIGTGESPPGSNCNPITARCRLGCCAWCDETIWNAWFDAGFNADGHIHMPGIATDYWFGDAYVPNTMRNFQAAGRFFPTPIPGAAGVHFWGGPETNSHIVMYCQDYDDGPDGTLLNIEGNHNNVCEYVKRRKKDSTRKGYCHPPFSSAEPPKVRVSDDPFSL